jgi:dihydrofolate reductase
VAGFVDFGECLEEAVAREVLEETGVRVRSIQYIGSPCWPFRPLDPPTAPVRAVSGSIAEVIAEAKTTAAGKDVYLDGGIMIRAALDAGLVDHYIITVIPTALGSGIPLFHGIAQRARLKLVGNYRYWDNMFQLHFEPVRQP